MQKLTNKEEEIMHILWKLKKAFVKEVIEEITVDPPHYNTLSTIIRNLEEKGYVGYHAFGKTHQYYPIVAIEEYRKNLCILQLTIILIVRIKIWCHFLQKRKRFRQLNCAKF